MTTEDLINRLIPPDCRRLLVDTIYGQRKVYSVDEWREAIRGALAEQRGKILELIEFSYPCKRSNAGPCPHGDSFGRCLDAAIRKEMP